MRDQPVPSVRARDRWRRRQVVDTPVAQIALLVAAGEHPGQRGKHRALVGVRAATDEVELVNRAPTVLILLARVRFTRGPHLFFFCLHLIVSQRGKPIADDGRRLRGRDMGPGTTGGPGERGKGWSAGFAGGTAAIGGVRGGPHMLAPKPLYRGDTVHYAKDNARSQSVNMGRHTHRGTLICSSDHGIDRDGRARSQNSEWGHRGWRGCRIGFLGRK